MEKEKKKKKTLIEFNPTMMHLNAMAYCLSNGITITPELIKKETIRLNIRIEKDGHIKNMVSPVSYTNRELTRPIYEIYLTYFKRMVSEDVIKKSQENYLSFKNNV